MKSNLRIKEMFQGYFPCDGDLETKRGSMVDPRALRMAVTNFRVKFNT